MTNQSQQGQFGALADRLDQRCQAILSAWRQAVAADPALSTSSQLTLADFMDGVPRWLDAFGHELRCLPVTSPVRKKEYESAGGGARSGGQG